MKNPKDFAVILNRIQAAQNWRDSNYKDKWKKYLRLYRSTPLPKEPGFSNIFIPQTFMLCETVKARVSESLFANRPYVSVLPRGIADADNAALVQSLLDWQLNERMNIKRIFSEDVLQDAIVLGTTVTFTGWLKRERKVKRTVVTEMPLPDGFGGYMVDEIGLPIMMPARSIEEQTLTEYDDPVLQKVDLFDFYVDRTATDIKDARFCGHVEYLTKEQIKNFEQIADWQVDWKKLAPVTDLEDGKGVRSEISSVSNTSFDDSYDRKDKNGKYEVLHYWEDTRHMVIINRTQCVLDSENPFNHGQKPYDKCCYVPLTNEFYGIGIPEIVEDLQDELNTNRNMRIDYNAAALRRMWKLRKGCGIEPKDLVWRQNGVLQVDEMDDVMEINIQSLPASAFSNEEIIKQDMRDATGVQDIILGLAQSDETATTTMTKDNNASIRFKYFIEALVDSILIPMTKKSLSMDVQYLEDERIIRLTDNEGQAGQILTILPEQLDGDYDFYYVGSSVEPMANKELYKQKVIEVYQLLMANPLVQQDMEVQKNLIKEVVQAAEMKDPEALVPQIQPMMQQQNPLMPQSQQTTPTDTGVSPEQLATIIS